MQNNPIFDLYLEAYEEAVIRTLNEPEWFCEEILHFKLKAWQLKAVNVVLDVKRLLLGIPTLYNHDGKQRLTIRSCHGTGKTQFLAVLAHIWNFINYGKIAATAPKEAQLTKRFLPRYRFCMRNAEQSYRNSRDVQGKEIKIFEDPDWGVNLETASDPDNLSGYHDLPQLFIIDEASAKRLELMYPVIEGAITTPGSMIVEIGNPTRTEGEFYDHHNKKELKDLYYRMHIKHTDAPDLISPQWVESMRIKYGENSPIYLVRVAGEFAAFDEYTLIPPEWIEDALDREDEGDGSHPILKISIDVADGGADSTIITAALEYQSYTQVIKQKSYNFQSSVAIPEAVKAAKNMFDGFNGRKNIDQFIVDAIGVGAGVAGMLIDDGYDVIRNVGGEASDDPDKYRNRRVQNCIALYDAYSADKIRFSPDCFDTPEDAEEYRAHVLSIKRNKDNEKVDDIEPKKNIKKDGLPSPDRFDSVAQLYNGTLPEMGLSAVIPEVIDLSVNNSYDGGLVE